LKLDAADLADLQPLIDAIVRSTVERMRETESKLGTRIGFTEKEAAEELGIERHRLRDARQRGEIAARRVGRGFVYGRQALVDFLNDTK
jgi:Helix-turn-helix domain